MPKPLVGRKYSILLTALSALAVLSLAGLPVGGHDHFAFLNSRSSLTQEASAALADFNFAAAGDWGCMPDTTNTVNNIVSHSTEITFGLGDFSYESTADCWFDVTEPIDDQMKITIGNHDDTSSKLLNQYMTHFGLEKQYYSFNYQNIHFLTISTELSLGSGSEQYNFVVNDLSNAASDLNIKWIVVYFHKPAYLSPSDVGITPYTTLRNTYHPLFDQYGVDLVLQAHQHAYERSYPLEYNNAAPSNPIITDSSTDSYNDPEGQVYATVGTGGDSLDDFSNKASYIVTQSLVFGFLNVDVSDDGSRMKATFYANDGSVKDQFTINKVPPNQPPTAEITANPTTVNEGGTAALDASTSSDPDGTIASYDFDQTAGTPGTITMDSVDPSKATFTAPSVSADETATIQVTVTDNDRATDSTTVDIAIKNVQEHSTLLTLNAIKSVPWGKDVTVTGKLTDNDASGAGASGKTITFDGTGAANLQPAVTNGDGTFSAKGASSSTVATGWKVQAHFAGDSDYKAANSLVKAYTTFKHSTYISVSSAKSGYAWGIPTSFTATLTDTSLGGIPISGKTIHFDGTGVINLADQTTGSDGKAIGAGTAPDTVATGWTYQAHFAGDSLYNKKDSPIKTYSTTKHATTLSLLIYPNTSTTPIKPGATYKVFGILTDYITKQPLGSKTITFTATSPITIPDATTGATDGKYSVTGLKAPNNGGSYSIQSHFAGDEKYSAKNSPTKTLNVT
jgi:hypothetical protein